MPLWWSSWRFNFCSCSCCSRRTPKVRCIFANATFTGGRATARSHENRSRGGVLSCRVRWHMRGGMRVPYHARVPQQREQRSRFGHFTCSRRGCGPWVSIGTIHGHNTSAGCHPATSGVEHAIRQLIIGNSHRIGASWPSEPTRGA